MSTSTLRVHASPAGISAVRGLRLRLKPTHQRCGFVQGAWWPRSLQLATELPALLGALSLRLGRIERVIYDQNCWAPAPLRLAFEGSDVILEASSDQSIDTLSVIGEQFETLVLLVVSPFTDPGRAYTTVMTAAKPDNVSTADELLGIGAQAAEDRRLALIAHQRWESEGGALRLPGRQSGARLVSSIAGQEVRIAQ